MRKIGSLRPNRRPARRSISLTFKEMDALDSLLSSDIAGMEDQRLSTIIAGVIRKIRSVNLAEETRDE